MGRAVGSSGRSNTAARERALQALLSLAESLSVESEPEHMLRSALADLVRTLELTGAIGYLNDPADEELSVVAVHRFPEVRRVAAARIARRCQEGGTPQLEAIRGAGWLAAAPLVRQRRALGALVFFEEREDEPPPDNALLEGLGRQLGTGLDNARLHAELRAASQRADAMSRISRSLASGSDLKTVMPAFSTELATLQDFDRLCVAFVDESGDYLQVVTDPPEATWGLGEVVPVVGSGLGSVVLNDRPVLQSDLLHQHRYIEDMRLLEDGLRCYVLMPLSARQQPIGVLAMGSNRAGHYDETTLARMQPLVGAVAHALENLRLFQKTRQLSITDEVTPLYNVRFFHQILDRELKLVDRYQSVLSLLFIDLDKFKPINDQYGHLRGTRVLREVGFLISASVRETDYPVRYGGDEFCIVLPQTDTEAACNFAERLRAAIQNHPFLQEEGIDARLGASLGVATYPTEADSKEALIRLADQRMYRDKEERKER